MKQNEMRTSSNKIRTKCFKKFNCKNKIIHNAFNVNCIENLNFHDIGTVGDIEDNPFSCFHTPRHHWDVRKDRDQSNHRILKISSQSCDFSFFERLEIFLPKLIFWKYSLDWKVKYKKNISVFIFIIKINSVIH